MDEEIFEKINNDIKKSSKNIIKNDTKPKIVNKIVNKYNDMSDTEITQDNSDDESDEMSFVDRHNDIISQLSVNSTKKVNKNEEKKQKYEQIVKNQNETEYQYEFSADLEKNVKLYVSTDDEIRALKEKLKVLNEKKMNTEKEILKHLERLGESNINVTGGKLCINKYEQKAPLKEDIINAVINKKFNNQEISMEILDSINLSREMAKKIRMSIKRTFERKTA
jgi:hypothetical protein